MARCGTRWCDGNGRDGNGSAYSLDGEYRSFQTRAAPAATSGAIGDWRKRPPTLTSGAIAESVARINWPQLDAETSYAFGADGAHCTRRLPLALGHAMNTTSEEMLEHRHILVCEGEPFVANELVTELSSLGATVIGPASTLKNGRALLARTAEVDGAVLDVNSHGEDIVPLADELAARDVPFMFITGCDASAIPPRFAHVRRCAKPVAMSALVSAVLNLVEK